MYKCERCGYTTEYKSNLKNHFKRKKICPPILSDTSIETLKLKINQKLIKTDRINQNGENVSTNVSTNSKNVSTNVSTVSTNVSTNVSTVSTNVSTVSTNVSTKEYKCQFCNKIFKHRQSKYNHELKYCKFKNNSENSLCKESEDISKNLKKIGKDLKNIGKYLKDIGKDPKNIGKDPKDILIEKLMQENLELIDKVGNINNIQININNYGNENLDYLTTRFYK